MGFQGLIKKNEQNWLKMLSHMGILCNVQDNFKWHIHFTFIKKKSQESAFSISYDSQVNIKLLKIRMCGQVSSEYAKSAMALQAV